VVFVGKAQEKTAVFRTDNTSQPYPWIVRGSAIQLLHLCAVAKTRSDRSCPGPRQNDSRGMARSWSGLRPLP
jgi:hypothetical protein